MSWLVLAGIALIVGAFIFKRRKTVEQARKLVAEGAELVDVRTPEEFRGGHLPGAVNIPVQELAVRWQEVGPTTRAVVVYCRSGARSTVAAQLLKQAGYAQVVNIGPMSAW